MVAVGGSDTHRLRGDGPSQIWTPRLGEPTSWVRTGDERTAGAVLAALRRGDLFLSATPDGPELYIEAERTTVIMQVVNGQDAILAAITDAGVVAAYPLRSNQVEEALQFPDNATYIRAQIVDRHGNVLALSNPVWRDRL